MRKRERLEKGEEKENVESEKNRRKGEKEHMKRKRRRRIRIPKDLSFINNKASPPKKENRGFGGMSEAASKGRAGRPEGGDINAGDQRSDKMIWSLDVCRCLWTFLDA